MAVKNQLAKAKDTSLSAYLSNDAVKNQINQIVGGKDGPKFISALVSAVQVNPQLQECSKPSLLSAALLGHSLNLSPSPQLGQYYMVPFDNKKKGVKEASFILGYRGMIQLAVRSGYYKRLNALAIKEGELVRYDPLNEEIEVKLIEDETEREKAPTAGYYAMFEYANGFRKTMYWSRSKMISHADRYSPAFSANATSGKYPKVSFADYEAGKVPKGDDWLYSSFWYKDFDGMAIKTMLRQIISKWGIMSIDLQKAMETDAAVIREDLTPDYVEQEEEAVVYTQDQPVAAVEQKEAEQKTKPTAEKPAETKPSPAPVEHQQEEPSIEDEFFGGM